MEILTNFADQAVLLPLIGVVAAGLAASGWWRALGAWLVAVPGVLVTTVVLKYLFFACAGPLGSIGIQSPSGHTAAGSAIYGGALMLALKDRASPVLLAMIPVGFATAFGVSRVAVGVHTVPDVVAGGFIGITGAMAMLPFAGLQPPLRLWPILGGVLFVLAATYGNRLQVEKLIHQSPLSAMLPLPRSCTQALQF